MRLKPGRIPFLAILKSPYRADIDELLFVQQYPVLQVYRWLKEDMGVRDISYSMLWRYKHAMEEQGVPHTGRQAADRHQEHYQAVTRFIQHGMETLEQGVPIRPAEFFQAIELQLKLLDKMGIDVRASLEEVDTFERDLALHLIDNIVIPVLTEEQRADILYEIRQDPELSHWLMSNEDEFY